MLSDLVDGLVEDVLACAEDVDAVAALLREAEQLLHQVDAGHPLRQRRAEQARCPDHALAVGVHEVAALDDLPHPGVVSQRHELGRVDRHVLPVAAGGDQRLDAGERVPHARAVDACSRGRRPVRSCQRRRPRARGSRGTRRSARRRRARPAWPSHSGIAHGVGGAPPGAHGRERRRVVAEQARSCRGVMRDRALGVRRGACSRRRRARRPPPARRRSRSRSRRRPPAARGSRGSPSGSMQRTPAPRAGLEPACRPRRAAGARVDREDHRRAPRRARRAPSTIAARLVGLVDVRGPVERHEHVLALALAPSARHAARSRALPSQRRSESIIVLPT